jgi:Protein of unknown function (DUF3261)
LRAILTSLLGLLAGCAVFATRPADPGLFLLPPSAAGRQASLAQSVRMTSDKGATFEALAAVEIDPRWLRVAALGPMGNRIMLLEWDGQRYQEERDPHLPADFPLKVVLRDLEFALFPAAAVRKALPSSAWVLLETPRARELRLDGTPVIRIDYSSDDPYTSTIHFKHLTLGYQLEIRPADTD